MSRKVDRLEIKNGFFVVTTRGASAFSNTIRKEAQRIATAVQNAARPVGGPRPQQPARRRERVA